MNRLLAFLFITMILSLPSGAGLPERVEPPFWWIGFRQPAFQLMVFGTGIGECSVVTDYPGFIIRKTHRTTNPNYLFVDVELGPKAVPGTAQLQFKKGNHTIGSYRYELKQRKPGSAVRRSYSSADVIYLLMPDRFANGDTSNDASPLMKEGVDRSNQHGRHGGDIRGIIDHIGYLKDLGISAVWINPLLENNQEKYSYHGYSTTDYYKVDPRIGTNQEYVELSEVLHRNGIKLIQDMIFNHCGSGHWWIKDLPADDWINQWPEFTRTNYRINTVNDPYASLADSTLFIKGWFDRTMPDLNQQNPFVRTYLIQNSIWWIEFAGLDGIRQDTHPYPFKEMMAEWGQRILEEYPYFNITGECWLNEPGSVSYWQKGKCNGDGYNSHIPSVFDFPLYNALFHCFKENDGWSTGIIRLHDILAQDFNYPDPGNLVIFADNHDVNRYLDSQNDDIRAMKMAMAFILTTRGIPQIYYGTEILMTTGEDKGDGNKRKDFPGGWKEDSRNAFTRDGRTETENDMFDYMRNLIRWRNENDVIHKGNLRHFIPDSAVYVYFRFNTAKTVMVVMNNHEGTRHIKPERYKEFLHRFSLGRDIITGATLNIPHGWTINGKSAQIIELK